MRRSYPNIVPSVAIEPRKITRVNMDNVANALLLLTNFQSFNGATALAASITITYNRIQVMFNEDPDLTLQTLKLSRKWFFEYLRDLNDPNPGIKPWFWDSVRGSPTFLSAALDILESPDFVSGDSRIFAGRVFIALLSLDRVMVIPGTAKYDTITNPGVKIDVKSSHYPSDIRTAVNALGFTPEDFKARFEHEVNTFRYTVLNSAGVNGDATWTAHSDARAWAASLDSLNLVREFSTEAGLKRIFNDMLGCVPIKLDEDRKLSDLKLGRIHSFDEWGGKVRSVAIVDYWTQMLMTPLHNTINHFLRQIPSDGTFDQLRIAERVRAWTAADGVEVNSFDLSAATDRLPISLQTEILSVLLGNSVLATLWSKMMVDRDYFTADGVALRYSVGQPMGARSSFPMLALTHHIIVQHAARDLPSGTMFSDYVILGDDMSVANPRVAENYKATMALLGVTVNLSKSVVHNKLGASAAEICKRLFISGVEYTTINPKLIAKTVRTGSLAPTLQDDLGMRGFKLSGDLVTNFFFALTDRESFKELMLLNIIPGEVSGIHNRVDITGNPLSNIANWYPGLKGFSSKTVANVFTYTAAVESLKRLDSLLRQTLAIGTAISEKWDLYTESPINVKKLWMILGIPVDVESGEVSEYLENLNGLTPFHPIVRASESEIERITELLSGLISVDTEMYNRARNGLLDICRNALLDIWQDNDEARAAASRSLFNKSMLNIKSMVAKGTVVNARQPTNPIYDTTQMTLEYSITLSQIQRMWVVRVGLVDGVTINAVKSRVSTSASIVKTQAQSVVASITL